MVNNFYVGIDLGTSRTSVSSSTGKRFTIWTCVGYTKDVVARKRFNREYLLGEEALDNRLSLNVIFPLAEGVIREDELSKRSIKLILEDAIKLAFPDLSSDDNIFAAIGAPAKASIENKKDIIKVSSNLFKKVIIVSEPFAVAYGMDRLDECLICDIGAGTVDIMRMKGTIPEPDDQIMLTTAGNFLDKVLEEKILEKYPKVQLTPRIVRRVKEKYGYVSKNADTVSVEFTEEGKPNNYDLTDIIRESCMEMANKICDSIKEMVSSFDPEFQAALRNNVIITGGGSRLVAIDRLVEEGLVPYGGGNATCVEEPEFAGSNGALLMALEMPEEYWEELPNTN